MKKIFYLFMFLLFIVGCEPDDDGLEVEGEVEAVIDSPELSSVEGDVLEISYGGLPMEVQDIGDAYLHQGDILIPKNLEEPVIYASKDSIPSGHKATSRINALWENNVVYYQIDGNLPNQERVTDAIKHWEENTNLNFIRSSRVANYIYFTSGSGCSSYIGKIGGKQNITVGTSCSTGNVIHEIGHAVGLFHEHSRADRDEFVIVHFENIQAGREHNFKTYPQLNMDGQELTNTLDFSSIMLYSSYAFSTNGKPTITKLNGYSFPYQRRGLSSGDIRGINKLYPEGQTEPVYENNKFYIIDGITMARAGDRWWFYTKYGWMEIAKSSKSGFWYYV